MLVRFRVFNSVLISLLNSSAYSGVVHKDLYRDVLTAWLIRTRPHFRPEEGELSTAEICFLSCCELDRCHGNQVGTVLK